MTPIILLAALAGSTAPVPQTVEPERNCTSTLPVMARQLAEHYGERPAGGGAELAGDIAVLFVNDRTGSWTVVYSGEGSACIVGAGTGWRFAPKGEAL